VALGEDFPEFFGSPVNVIPLWFSMLVCYLGGDLSSEQSHPINMKHDSTIYSVIFLLLFLLFFLVLKHFNLDTNIYCWDGPSLFVKKKKNMFYMKLCRMV
jgi:amino acid transporter